MHISIPRALGLRLAKLVGYREGFRSVTDVILWAIRKQGYQIETWIKEIEKEDIFHDIKECKNQTRS